MYQKPKGKSVPATQRRTVRVLHPRAGCEDEAPAGVLEAPGEVGVLGGADPLLKAADGVEGGAADEQVGGGDAGTERVGEVRP